MVEKCLRQMKQDSHVDINGQEIHLRSGITFINFEKKIIPMLTQHFIHIFPFKLYYFAPEISNANTIPNVSKLKLMSWNNTGFLKVNACPNFFKVIVYQQIRIWFLKSSQQYCK